MKEPRAAVASRLGRAQRQPELIYPVRSPAAGGWSAGRRCGWSTLRRGSISWPYRAGDWLSTCPSTPDRYAELEAECAPADDCRRYRPSRRPSRPGQPARIMVESAGLGVVQDLGRPGHGDQGIAVKEPETAARHGSPTCSSATPRVRRCSRRPDRGSPSGSPPTPSSPSPAPTPGRRSTAGPSRRGSRSWSRRAPSLVVPTPDRGWRVYVAIAGGPDAPRTLGSVAPDVMLGAGRRLSAGDRLDLSSCVCGWRHPHAEHALFRLGARRPSWPSTVPVDVTPGPEIDEFETSCAARPLDRVTAVRPHRAARGRADTCAHGWQRDPVARRTRRRRRGTPAGRTPDPAPRAPGHGRLSRAVRRQHGVPGRARPAPTG